MKKAIYLPTNQNTIIISELENYYEILLDGEYKTVPRNEVQCNDDKITLSSLDEAKKNIFINCVKNPLNDILYSLNSNRLIPEPHQYKPLTKFLNSENNKILIADEVGLGKTIEAGMIYKEIKCREDIKISIIVVPSSLTIKWKEELSIRFGEFFEIMKTNQFLSFIDDFENFNTSKVFDEKIIISYHTLRDERVIDKLNNGFLEVDFLIMDEAHSFRNDATSTFEGAEVLTSISDHILFLTATPVQNDLRDIFNILSLLDNESFMDFDYFKRMIQPNRTIHYTIALLRNNNSLETIKNSIGELDLDYKNELLDQIHNSILKASSLTSEQRVKLIDELTKMDHLSYIINRTKKRDVGRLLPRNANSVIVDITSQERDFYAAVIDFVRFIHPNTPQGFITIMPERMASSSMLASFESFKKMKKEGKLFLKDIDDLDEGFEDIDIKAEALSYLDKIIEKGKLIGNSDSKFLRFIEIVNSIQEQGIKQIIVFSFFKYTLNYLQKKLSNMNYKVGVIHGDYTVEERFDIIKSFKKGAFDILLSSEVGSEGLDMQFCNVVVNYDLPWNPMRVEQRIGRIDRIGQKFDKLHIFNLCILGSIEDRIFLRLYDKLNIFEQSLGEFEPVLGNLERDLNIPELLDLTQEELNEKIHLQELSIKRQEVEIVTQSKELEKLISDDFEINTQKDELLSSVKLKHIQFQIKILVNRYLDENAISYFEDKNGTLRLTSDNIIKLFQLLRSNMSDKRLSSLDYKEERLLLHRIQNKKVIRISFDSTQNDEFNTIFVNINHPIIKMITRNHNVTTTYSCVNTSSSIPGYAVTYRVDIKHLKKKSWINTLILDEFFNLQKEMDYFDFINDTKPFNDEKGFDFEKVKNKVSPLIINQIETLREAEIQSLSRQIEVMKNSITTHFDKKIRRVIRMENSVNQDDIKRMRIAERNNLIEQCENKMKEIEQRKNVVSSFEIIAVMKTN